MGGNKKKKLFSFMSFFKAKKEYASDEDNILKVVAEPEIDKIASSFIVNFHSSRVSEAIHHHQAGWGLPHMNPLLLRRFS